MSKFFAMLSRMRFIRRWGLMRNVYPENVQEHSLQCAQIAHALAAIHNARFGGGANPARAAELAIFHEAAEVITGDLPTPVKYHDAALTTAYKSLEEAALCRIMDMLPEDIAPFYSPLILTPQQDAEWSRVKAADRICAYLKCVEEERMGNREFEKAKLSILRDIQDSPLPEVGVFMAQFAPYYAVTLDELNP